MQSRQQQLGSQECDRPSSSIKNMSCSINGSAGARAIPVEISIDISNLPVSDHYKQQDGGSSNQSASDSGIGHTNSLSSDNSSLVNQATGLDRKKEDGHNVIISNASESEQTIDSNANAIVHDLNNNILASQTKYHAQNQNCLGDVSNSAIEQISICTNRSINQHDAHIHEDTINSKGESGSRAKDNDVNDQAIQSRIDHCFGSPPEHSSGNAPISSVSQKEETSADARFDESFLITRSPSASIVSLKSSLKKRSPNNLNDVSDRSFKNNRNVSFNQTVIVFCEEIESFPANDQCDLPSDYQDPSSKGNRSGAQPKFCGSTRGTNDYKVDNSTEDLGILGKIVSTNTSDLTDEQLFGLLEDESLLENFKIDGEQYSDDDFSVDQLNSNQSYLCVDAISDTESESEASHPLKKTNLFGKEEILSSGQTSICNTRTKSLSHDVKISSGIKKDFSKSSGNSEKDGPSKVAQQQHKLMPARMKVSTLDNSQLKRSVPQENQHHHMGEKIHKQSSELKKVSAQTPSSSSPSQEFSNQLHPMVNKQSNVESVALTKPVFVRNDIVPDDKQQTQRIQGTIDADRSLGKNDQISTKSDSNIPGPQRTNQFQTIQTDDNSAISNSRAKIIQSQPACQICRAIESHRNQTINPSDVVLTAASNCFTGANFYHQPPQVGSSLVTQNHLPNSTNNILTQPVVLNPTCASCREVSHQQQAQQQHELINQQFLKNQGQLIANQAVAAPRSIAPQIVYVVDQKGNRVRALQLLGPTLNNPGIGVQASRHVVVAPIGYRFPNPNALIRHNIRPPIVACPISCAATSTCNTDQDQAAPCGSVQQSTVREGQHYQMVNRDPLSPSGHGTANQSIPARHRTIYYVRHPPGSQNVRQSFGPIEPHQSSRPFPDAHEIRRLDGLKGPITNLSLSQKSDLRLGKQESDQQVVSEGLTREDDPTFGFSNRPSVKVVSSNSGSLFNSSTMTKAFTFSKNCNLNTSGRMVSIQNIASEGENLRVNHQIDAGSQTLDRRPINRNVHVRTNEAKENIPSTSSMSNINGTLNSGAEIALVGREKNGYSHSPSSLFSPTYPILVDSSKAIQ